MEYVVSFCNIRNILSLSWVNSHIRELHEMREERRVLREALVGGDSLAYLTDYSVCALQGYEPISLAKFANIPLRQLVRRIIAHAIMQGSRAIVAWIMDVVARTNIEEMYIDSVHALGGFHIARGDDVDVMMLDNIDNATYHALPIVAQTIASRGARPAHIELIEKMMKTVGFQTRSAGDILTQLCWCFANRAGSERAREWFESLVAHDVARACAVVPVAREIMTDIFARNDVEREIGACVNHLYAPIGPLFTQYFLAQHILPPIIARYAHNSHEITQCMREFEERCARVEVADLYTREFIAQVICAAAKNPDDAVFARVIEIARTYGRAERKCAIFWSHFEGFATFARVIACYDSAEISPNFDILLRVNGMTSEIAQLNQDDALEYLRIITARMSRAELLKHKSNANIMSAIMVFGEPFERAARESFA